MVDVNIHLIQKRANRLFKAKAIGYNSKNQMNARRSAVAIAKSLGHDMTRFGYLKELEAVQSSCRKCHLRLEDFNFMVKGPAMEYTCGVPEPAVRILNAKQ